MPSGTKTMPPDQHGPDGHPSGHWLRIACVYKRHHFTRRQLMNMARIRFYRMAEALARA